MHRPSHVPSLLLALSLLAPVATPAATPALAQSAAPATVVHDFTEIAVGEPRVELDPSGTAATIRVTSTQVAACSVVFGTDEAFGRLATDADMAAGGHTDHHPILGGLTPDTTYLYRLQGTTADGTLYQSRTLSFHTPPAPAGGPDLALEASVADVSSEYGAAYAATNAIDGDLTTEWSSAGDGDAAFITIDLGTPQVIGSVAWVTRSMSDGTATTKTFTLTADGVEIGTFPAGSEPVAVSLTAQVLRFDVASSTGGNTGAREIVVRGPDASQ